MKILTYLRSSLSDSNKLAYGEPGRYTQRGENRIEGQNGEGRGAEEQWETKTEQQVSRVLGSRKPSIEQYLGGKAG